MLASIAAQAHGNPLIRDANMQRRSNQAPPLRQIKLVLPRLSTPGAPRAAPMPHLVSPTAHPASRAAIGTPATW